MNKNFKNYAYLSFALALATTMASCSDDDNKVEIQETDAAYVGKEVGNFTADEWYPGGKLGTTENTGSSSYSDQTPAVDNDPELFKQFFIGEQIFERQYSWNTGVDWIFASIVVYRVFPFCAAITVFWKSLSAFR